MGRQSRAPGRPFALELRFRRASNTPSRPVTMPAYCSSEISSLLALGRSVRSTRKVELYLDGQSSSATEERQHKTTQPMVTATLSACTAVPAHDKRTHPSRSTSSFGTSWRPARRERRRKQRQKDSRPQTDRPQRPSRASEINSVVSFYQYDVTEKMRSVDANAKSKDAECRVADTTGTVATT